jgi:ABC-type transporter Mla subunit MlaD
MPRTSNRLDNFAAQLGNLLGTAEKRARTWIGQRQQIAKSLANIRDTANSLLSELGHDAQRAVKRGRKALTTSPGRRRRSGMSAAQRAEVSRRMKAYWAKRRKEKAK